MALPDKALLLNDWDRLRYQVKEGIKRLGHDIPIVGYSAMDELKIAGNEKSSRNMIKDQTEGR